MRLKGFDYTRPYFYMVTLKKLKGAAAFSEVVDPGVCRMNSVTRAFVYVIRHYCEKDAAVESIECFSVMPDHVHLLIKIAGETDSKTLSFKSAGKPLGDIVDGLRKALERAYWEVRAKEGDEEAKGVVAEAKKTKSLAFPPVFFADWHDWIIKCKTQLKAFTKYIRENPKRHWLRKVNAKYFGRVREIVFLGRRWWAYGNIGLIDLPVLEPIRCHRYYKPGMREWDAWLGRARRIGSGGAGVSTFMSECEKACGHEIALAGGKFIVLSPENFPPAAGETIGAEGWKTRWHPSARLEPACARGDLLFITLYEPLGRQPTRSELYKRCHEMGDIVMAGLGSGQQTQDS